MTINGLRTSSRYEAGALAAPLPKGNNSGLLGTHLTGYLRAGGFPREMAVLPGGHTLLVGNFDSEQIESVDTAELP